MRKTLVWLGAAIVVLLVALTIVYLLVSRGSVAATAPDYRSSADLYFQTTPGENIVVTDSSGAGFVNNELLCTASDGVSAEQLSPVLAEYGGSIVGYNRYLDRYQVQFDRTYSEQELVALQAQLDTTGLFAKTSENLFVPLVTSSWYTPNDSEWSGQWEFTPGGSNWGMEAISAPEMWGEFDLKILDPVNVGVLDNQFYTGHEDLSFAGTFWNDFDEGGTAHGDYRHGTHVAGTIAATFDNGRGVAGVAPRVNLYGASMLGLTDRPANTGIDGATVNEMEAGLTYLICVEECKVINFSYSWGDQRVADEITAALRLYVEDYGLEFVIVKAAGNSAVDARRDALTLITDPVVEDRIIVVGSAALSQDGTLGVAGYSNYGPRVDLVAPGTDIHSTMYQSTNPFRWSHSTYGLMSGTSMAAPHVSGVAAAIWSIRPELTGPEVKRIICDSASGSYTYADPRVSQDSYGLLDAYGAAEAAAEYVAASPAGGDILPDLPPTFIFSIGVGGWSTEVSISPDGTFAGRYSDWEWGETGTGYPNGTLYESIFSGRFGSVTQLGDYEYSMRLEYLDVEGTVGEERVVDGVKVITSDPYGLDYADEFLLYLPGRDTTDLPEEFLYWLSVPLAWDGIPEVLPLYGLYNVGGEQGFYSETETTPAEEAQAPPSDYSSAISEQRIKQILATTSGASEAEVYVYAYENFGEWAAAAADPGVGSAVLQVVFSRSGGEWSLFWLQTYTVSSSGMAEFEDPNPLRARGVPQEVIDWLNTDL
jgi:subtilisin family serine protease